MCWINFSLSLKLDGYFTDEARELTTVANATQICVYTDIEEINLLFNISIHLNYIINVSTFKLVFIHFLHSCVTRSPIYSQNLFLKLMNTCNGLPAKILRIIATYCERDCTQAKWMLVNRRWFTFYPTKTYSTIGTSLSNESIINKILHSPFDIGKHIKHINLSNIQRSKGINGLVLHLDFLGEFMKRTSNVCKISFFFGTTGASSVKTVQTKTGLISL